MRYSILVCIFCLLDTVCWVCVVVHFALSSLFRVMFHASRPSSVSAVYSHSKISLACFSSKTKTVSTELRPSTNKDRYMEEQKKKFRRFSRSGLTVSDADTLVDHLFEPQPWKPLPPYQTRTLPSMPHVGAGHNSGHIGEFLVIK